MYNQNKIISIYNQISDETITKKDLLPILPKLYLILNKVKIDNIEMANIIDVLNEFKKYGQLDKINSESIDLVNSIVGREKEGLLSSLYYSIVLKHVLLPYKLDVCDSDYNLMMFLSEFEIFIELCNQTLNNKKMHILEKYNNELKNLILKYKEVRKIYKRYVINDVILDMMTSHFATMLYFNLDEFNNNYDLLVEMMYRIIENYQQFIDYCCSFEIHKNYTRMINDISKIEMEYIISYKMLKYLSDNKEKEKRKCLNE